MVKLEIKIIVSFIVMAVNLISCESEFEKDEFKIDNNDIEAYISEIGGNRAQVIVQLNGFLSKSYQYKKNANNFKLYYGQSEDPKEMKDFSYGQTGPTRSGNYNNLMFELSNLTPLTEYHIALKVDTIYVAKPILKYQNVMKLLTTDENGFFIPTGVSSFTTMDDLKAVDLGLSVLWAEKDLGANEYWNAPTYAWTANEISSSFPFLNIAGTEYDPVTKILGEGWRMPSSEEYNELITNCTIEHRIDGDNGGYINCRSNINDNNITFYSKSADASEKADGIRWTSSVYESSSSLLYIWTFKFNTTDEELTTVMHSSSKKYPIRPVHVK